MHNLKKNLFLIFFSKIYPKHGIKLLTKHNKTLFLKTKKR